MAIPVNPLRAIQDKAGAEFMNFGPPPAEGGAELVQTFGHYPAEYAAIRQRVGIMHLPQRGLLRLTGADRADFLHRMLTCPVRELPGGSTRRGFQLNDKGRIVADVMVHHGDLDTWLETDVLDVEALHKLLEQRLFAEDVTIEDITVKREKLALHGPAALALLRAVADDAGAAERMARTPGTHHVIHVGGAAVSAYRFDDTGAMGLHLFVPTEAAVSVYERLLEAAGYDPQAEAAPDADYAVRRREGLRGRPIGWAAYNSARIEAGTPLFHVDFGHDSLPAETGLLEQAVSLNKGCYLGQEIVARMKNLGHPRRVLVGLKGSSDRQPVAGAQVFDQPGEGRDAGGRGGTGDVVGGVTSSTVSPLLGGIAIAFAVVKWGRHQPGTMLRVSAEGQLAEMQVHPLRFLPGGSAGGDA